MSDVVQALPELRRARTSDRAQRDSKTAACNRVLAGLVVLGTLAIAGCGEAPEDPTVTRSEAQADQLRERLIRGQGAQ